MTEDLLSALRDRIAREERMIVAYSGGVDSALLAAVAGDVLGPAALSVTAVSPSLPASERRLAKQFAADHGFAHVEVCTDEAERPEYVANGSDRCFHCKSALFDSIGPIADALGARIALGTNLDDLGDHRPGLRAAAERGSVAPLVDAGFGKQDVRDASHALGLRTADKPAAACLASRVAYGDQVTPEVLARIEEAEEAVRELGFARFRVRSHADGTVARIEVPAGEIQRAAGVGAELDSAVRASGFQFCALDLAGFSSGRMNTLLPLTVVGSGVA